MSKNPIINALAAVVYIVGVVLVINFVDKTATHGSTFVAPIAGISLFTLSAAVMGYLFCYQPIQLYFDGKKKQAVNLFLHTTLIFGCFTALALALLFTGVIK
jgi:hypothetical protein